jgi:hypothetical protein
VTLYDISLTILDTLSALGGLTARPKRLRCAQPTGNPGRGAFTRGIRAPTVCKHRPSGIAYRAHPGQARVEDSFTDMKSLKFDVFGRRVLVVGSENGWSVFYLGTEGKRRPAWDIVVPDSVSEAEVEQYLADLCHEWATERHPDVKRLE